MTIEKTPGGGGNGAQPALKPVPLVKLPAIQKPSWWPTTPPKSLGDVADVVRNAVFAGLSAKGFTYDPYTIGSFALTVTFPVIGIPFGIDVRQSGVPNSIFSESGLITDSKVNLTPSGPFLSFNTYTITITYIAAGGLPVIAAQEEVAGTSLSGGVTLTATLGGLAFSGSISLQVTDTEAVSYKAYLYSPLAVNLLETTLIAEGSGSLDESGKATWNPTFQEGIDPDANYTLDVVLSDGISFSTSLLGSAISAGITIPISGATGPGTSIPVEVTVTWNGQDPTDAPGATPVTVHVSIQDSVSSEVIVDLGIVELTDSGSAWIGAPYMDLSALSTYKDSDALLVNVSIDFGSIGGYASSVPFTVADLRTAQGMTITENANGDWANNIQGDPQVSLT